MGESRLAPILQGVDDRRSGHGREWVGGTPFRLAFGSPRALPSSRTEEMPPDLASVSIRVHLWQKKPLPYSPRSRSARRLPSTRVFMAAPPSMRMSTPLM